MEKKFPTILEKINAFIQAGDTGKELEITIIEEDISIKDYLKENSTTQVIKNNSEYCLFCKTNMKIGEFKRIINKCNHSFHKKCFDKWIKSSEKIFCIICNEQF